MAEESPEQNSPSADASQQADPADLEALNLPYKTATLQFFDSSDPKWATEKPFYSNIPFFKVKAANTNVVNIDVAIRAFNVRGHESHFTLDRTGFQLVKWNHTFASLGPSFQEEGYPAVTKFLKDTLGSHIQVCIFDHIVRRSSDDRVGPGQEAAYIGRPSRDAHNDQTHEGTVRKIIHDFGPQAAEILTKRFRIINVWKPLKGPIRQYPLTLCDYRTRNESDEHHSDLIYPHFISENMLFSHSKSQRWYYIGDQAEDEVWLIKTMDSANRTDPSIAQSESTSLATRSAETETPTDTPHTSFFDDDPAVASETRESIELRVYVIG